MDEKLKDSKVLLVASKDKTKLQVVRRLEEDGTPNITLPKQENEHIEQKIFHAEIVVDNDKVASETKSYQKTPIITNFIDEAGVDRIEEEINSNYKQIKLDVQGIVEEELKNLGVKI